VLVNLVGEYVVTTRSAVVDLVKRSLKPDDRLYLELKAKHFLQDSDSDIAPDLLALKLRTRMQPLADFTSLHMFVVSLRCEHSCPYCQVSRQSDDKLAFDMSESTASRSVDLVFR
jgi:sulfatase maturation enzyme AslB (radical SAM superfamily)